MWNIYRNRHIKVHWNILSAPTTVKWNLDRFCPICYLLPSILRHCCLLFLNRHHTIIMLKINSSSNNDYSGSSFHLPHKCLHWFFTDLIFTFYLFLIWDPKNVHKLTGWYDLFFFLPFFALYWRHQATIFLSNPFSLSYS